MTKLSDQEIQFIKDNANKPLRFIAKELDRSGGTISFYLSRIRKELDIPNCVRTDYSHMAVIGKEKRHNRATEFATTIWNRYKDEDRFIYGWLLYWCEGTRQSNFSFCNTNVDMLKFMQTWFTDYYQPLVMSYVLHHPLDDIKEQTLQYWFDNLNVVPNYYCLAKNTKKQYGVLSIEMRGITGSYAKFLEVSERLLTEYIKTKTFNRVGL